SREARSMSEPFLSSDDYDERAHQLYTDGHYDEAIEVLREGLGLYPHTVELHVGMGYARLARDEYVGARHALAEAVGRDPEVAARPCMLGWSRPRGLLPASSAASAEMAGPAAPPLVGPRPGRGRGGAESCQHSGVGRPGRCDVVP